jgi:hypothetical protein
MVFLCMKTNKCWLAALFFTSCSAQPSEEAQCDMTDFYIGDTAIAPVLTNTCEEAGTTPARLTKEYFSLEQFPVRLIVKRSGARFRSSPAFHTANLKNVLGFIAEKNELYAAGPIKSSDDGIYYVIPAIDVNGSLCLTYVSATVVTEKLQP